MGVECSYSFWDLFVCAHGREPSETEKQSFYAATQDERNIRIKKWAELASWDIDERIGTDGLLYTAFAPTFTPKK